VRRRSGTDPGPAQVVFVHGGMDRGASFGRTARRMRDADVVMYDRRGYARSHELEVSNDIAVQVADLLSVCDGRPSVVIGHSLGSVLALAAAAQEPEVVLSVGAYEAPLRWLTWWPKPSRTRVIDPGDVAESFMKRVAGDRVWRSLPEATRGQRRREGYALLADLAAIEQPPFQFGDVVRPTLVGYGSETEPHFRRGAEELAAQLPISEIRMIPGADHGPHLTHPDLFADFTRSAAALI
jgi:pimeloyl-ACP methyl ester carboxylesterase